MKPWMLSACVLSLWLIQPTPATTIFQSPDVNEWLGAAAEHQPGVEDAALRKIGRWSGVKLLRTLDEARSAPPSEELNALLERAALLHGDIMLLREDVDYWEGALESGGTSIRIQDGQQRESRLLEPHIRFARMIFAAMREPRSRSSSRLPALSWDEAHRRNPRIHQWYRTISSELASRHWLADLRPHLEDARRFLEDTPATMFDTACFSETLASAQVQRAVPRTPTSTSAINPQLRGEPKGRLLDERYNLLEAERYYRDALKLDPGYVEAHVRLARVLSLLGRDSDAFALLQAPSESPDPAIRYYGALALGRAAEGVQKAKAAREAYERAAALFPRAQSPLLALIRLARESVDDVSAREVAAAFASLGPVEPTRVDPWWDYFDCHGRLFLREREQLWSLYRRNEAR
jgi:tetratricopeptide (TPR) repeat protein